MAKPSWQCFVIYLIESIFIFQSTIRQYNIENWFRSIYWFAQVETFIVAQLRPYSSPWRSIKENTWSDYIVSKILLSEYSNVMCFVYRSIYIHTTLQSFTRTPAIYCLIKLLKFFLYWSLVINFSETFFFFFVIVLHLLALQSV